MNEWKREWEREREGKRGRVNREREGVGHYSTPCLTTTSACVVIFLKQFDAADTFPHFPTCAPSPSPSPSATSTTSAAELIILWADQMTNATAREEERKRGERGESAGNTQSQNGCQSKWSVAARVTVCVCVWVCVRVLHKVVCFRILWLGIMCALVLYLQVPLSASRSHATCTNVLT